MTHPPSLTALRAFEAAARHGSLTRAARELNVTAAAVSHQVKALERDLGVVLLRRRDGGVRPTEIAQAALADLSAGFGRIAAASRALRAGRGRRLLVVSADPSFAAAWLVPRLARFKATHPELDVRLAASDAEVDFQRDGIDLAIRYGEAERPGLSGTPLFAEEVCPVCSPALLEGPNALRLPRDLRGVTLVHLDGAPDGRTWPDWAAWLAAAEITGVDVGRGPHFSQFSMALQAAIAGQGVALGATSLVADDIAAGRLVAPFAVCLPARFAYHLIGPAETAEEPRIAAFRTWIVAEAKSMTGGGG
ncbi:MAG: transcriptional regulator GcvA [Alphaproteobacteria bacterium]